MSRRLNRMGLFAAAFLTLALPVSASLWLSYSQAVEHVRDRAAAYASEVLTRTTTLTGQIADAVRDLEATSLDQPCAPDTLIRMRELALASNAVAAIGYVADDRLLCSSFGVPEREVPVGPPDYVSALGNAVRFDRLLSIAPGTPLVMSTAGSGFTGIFHPIVALGVAAEDARSSVGVVGTSTRELLAGRGPVDVDWRARPVAEGLEGSFDAGGMLVAWKRVPEWDYFAYAALPGDEIAAGFGASARIMLPVGLAAGLILTFLLQRLVRHQQSMETLLRNALRRREMMVSYQPIVDMRTGAWVGAEALVRWRRPNGEFVPPEVFIPMAETAGLVGQVTDAVMARGLAEMAGHLRAHPSIFLAVNVGGADLRDPTFPSRLAAMLARHRLPAASIHIEATERELLDDEVQLETIVRLRAAGFAVAVDDFGVGYSNLSYLELVAFDHLKIDRLFVQRLDGERSSRPLIPAIVDMAASRGVTLIAEGVETREQVDRLLGWGVTLGQGYLFGRPMPAAAFIAGSARPPVAGPAGAAIAGAS